MKQIKRVPCQRPEQRDELVVIISANIMGSLFWAPDGNLFQVQDGQWYRLEVTDD